MTVWGTQRVTRVGARITVLAGRGLVAFVALFVTCACAGTGTAAEDEKSLGAEEVVRQAADSLVRAGTSRARTAMEMVSGGTRITIYAEGGFDYGERVGELRVMPPMDEDKPVTELFLPGLLYMKDRGAGVPPDKWVRVEVSSLPDGNLVTGGATDPITAAELLRGVRQADDLGETEIDGEPVRHYRGVTDIAAAAEATSSAECRDQLTAAIGGFTETMVPFDAYLDESGTLRRIRHRFSFARPGSGPVVDKAAGAVGLEVTSTVTLYDFGSPVRVTPPEREDIYSGRVVTTRS